MLVFNINTVCPHFPRILVLHTKTPTIINLPGWAKIIINQKQTNKKNCSSWALGLPTDMVPCLHDGPPRRDQRDNVVSQQWLLYKTTLLDNKMNVKKASKAMLSYYHSGTTMQNNTIIPFITSCVCWCFAGGPDAHAPSISPWKSPCTSKLNESSLGGTFVRWEENTLPWWVSAATSPTTS